MGQPWHEIRHLAESGQLIVFSANFPLYQSVSDRAYDLLSRSASRIQGYSIDEWWLDPAGAGEDLEGWAADLRQRLLTDVGVPSGVGIGPTKTLAKLANYGAKKYAPQTRWVVNLMAPGRQQKLMAITRVEEVWGIGSCFAKRLGEDAGITTALALAQADKRWLRRRYGVVVERTARELCGERCFAFEENPGKKLRIAATRAFGERISDIGSLQSAVATHASTVAEKLRRQESLCSMMLVFAHSSPFSKDPFVRGQSVVELPYPTNDTRELIAHASQAVQRFFRPGVSYAKAGVILQHIVDQEHFTKDLFSPEEHASSAEVMRALDKINTIMGRNTVRLARTQQSQQWKMRQRYLTPRYTTDWQALPVCR
jgi:DNA polymerase V